MADESDNSALSANALTDAQEKILAVLPIPSAILSIIGSSIIIYIAIRSREKRTWTPYTRLLIGMSICDIIFSVTISMATFLRPQETSTRVWAFGNDASCSAIAFLNQFSFSSLFYNGMLSFYFLLAARFRKKNSEISRFIEPCMHFVSIGYPLVAAVVGAGMGIYGRFCSVF